MLEKNYKISFDIGGTFTDIILINNKENKFYLHKCLTTPNDPSIGAIEGIKEILQKNNVGFKQLSQAIHGTTLITNALIERKGSKIGLLTTKGFKDNLEMGTEQRYDIHDLFLEFPKPLVERSLIKEIDERITSKGQIVNKINENEILLNVKKLVKKNIESLSICFLHSYKNPVHELIAKRVINKSFPNLFVSISSEIHPQIKEYERTSTTTANAYVQPLITNYISKISFVLKSLGFDGDFRLIQSTGGMASKQTCLDLPIRFLESGPAGGARNTSYIGKKIGKKNLISFDMGGTTAKTCLIKNNEPEIAQFLEVGRIHRFKKGSGFPVHSPVIDLIEIGAGGGSIARVDKLGLLKIGPESAGANPGPACYNLGGLKPTVTDALLVLGFLDKDYFLGGKLKLNLNAAKKSLLSISNKINLSIIDTAWGIYELVCENMANSINIHTVERNSDPRMYSLSAMGGAGPLHASYIAKKLGIKEIIIPPSSGAASAFGFFTAPTSFEISQSSLTMIDKLNLFKLKVLLKKLENKCTKKIREVNKNIENKKINLSADMRYSGQIHEISVNFTERDLKNKSFKKILEKNFKIKYKKLYNQENINSKIEILNWRINCRLKNSSLSVSNSEYKVKKNAFKNLRKVFFKQVNNHILVPVYDRYSLDLNSVLEGPLIVEEKESTTIVPPDFNLRVDNKYNLRIIQKKTSKGNYLLNKTQTLNNTIKKIENDPIGLEIMWNRLINITEECWQTVIKTAYSLVIGEAQDFGCEILDSKGNQIAHSPRAMPVFNLTLPLAIKEIINNFSSNDISINKGDILITNDPWLCAGHAYDIAVACPVFIKNSLIAFVGAVGHVSDIGGTLNHLKAQEMYEEGLIIPPSKLYISGKPNNDIFKIIKANVRNSDQVVGDLQALVSSCLKGSQRIIEFVNEYQLNNLDALSHIVQKRSEIAMKKAIKELPDGTYKNTIIGDGDNTKLHYPIMIKVKNSKIAVDFKGSPTQTVQGGNNCTLSYTSAHAAYALKCILTPEIPSNVGCYKPMSFSAPIGSIFNSEKPMAVNSRTRTGWNIAPNIFLALSKAAPKKVVGFSGLPSMIEVYGIDKNNNRFHDQLFQGGGQGASYKKDGKSGYLYPTSAANTSIEMFEARAPILVLCKELVLNSGGPGAKRGGLGQILKVRKLYNDGQIYKAGIYPNGVMSSVKGLFGGKSSLVAGAWLIKNNSKKINLGVGGIVNLYTTQDILILRIAGGSGYGSPFKRKREEVFNDLEEGYISKKFAKLIYGLE